MLWIDGNLGSGVNLKYPTTILHGDNSVGECISMAISGKNMLQDTGAKMIHVGRNTKSNILSKSIANENGVSNYRGLIYIDSNSRNSYANVSCDSLVLTKESKSDTIPNEVIKNNSSFIKHEAKITNLDKELVFYLNSRGFTQKLIKQIVSLGFIKPFCDKLPLEFSVEINRLLKQII